MSSADEGYREEYLGKPAIFLIPSFKLESIEFEIHSFLMQNYGKAWNQTSNVKGYWMGKVEGEYIKFEISFVGKEKIPNLKKFLAQICIKIGEECIYLITGADSWYIYPIKPVNQI